MSKYVEVVCSRCSRKFCILSENQESWSICPECSKKTVSKTEEKKDGNEVGDKDKQVHRRSAKGVDSKADSRKSEADKGTSGD